MSVPGPGLELLPWPDTPISISLKTEVRGLPDIAHGVSTFEFLQLQVLKSTGQTQCKLWSHDVVDFDMLISPKTSNQT